MKILYTAVFVLAAFITNAQGYKIVNNQVIVDKAITFTAGTATLNPESDAAIKIIKKYLDDKPYISLLRIECHTDISGDAKADQKLSEKRAYVVAAALMALGIDCKRLIPAGFGSTKPVAKNDTPEGRAANIRITLVNAALNGKLIGGIAANGGGVVSIDLCAQ